MIPFRTSLTALVLAWLVFGSARDARAAACADPDGNGVDVVDAANVLRAAVGLPSTCTLEPAACDLDGMHGIDRGDAADVLRRAAGLAPSNDCLPRLRLTE